MRLSLSPKNPFSYNRYGFLWQQLSQQKPGRHLDYGCYDGNVLRTLAETNVIAEGIGVDLNERAIHVGRPQMPHNVQLRTLTKGAPLPFNDESFDTISILDVIEHIVDQNAILDELQRVLTPAGTLIITVPKKHLLSILDVGNFKFIFPRLHRAVYVARHGKESYRRRYVDCENGLFGDIEQTKGWHQHFSEKAMTALLQRSNLSSCRFDGSGFFYRPLSIASHCSPHFLRYWLSSMLSADAKHFHSANLFCVAQKVSATLATKA